MVHSDNAGSSVEHPVVQHCLLCHTDHFTWSSPRSWEAAMQQASQSSASQLGKHQGRGCTAQISGLGVGRGGVWLSVCSQGSAQGWSPVFHPPPATPAASSDWVLGVWEGSGPSFCFLPPAPASPQRASLGPRPHSGLQALGRREGPQVTAGAGMDVEDKYPSFFAHPRHAHVDNPDVCPHPLWEAPSKVSPGGP